MGTNYYVHTGPSCGGKCEQHCRGEEIHLGKSSVGWAFTFRAYPPGEHAAGMPPFAVVDYASWERLLWLGEIRSEYGAPILREELIALVNGKRGQRNDLYGDNFLDPDGNRFIPGEFS
jgi:hypothetical protein